MVSPQSPATVLMVHRVPGVALCTLSKRHADDPTLSVIELAVNPEIPEGLQVVLTSKLTANDGTPPASQADFDALAAQLDARWIAIMAEPAVATLHKAVADLTEAQREGLQAKHRLGTILQSLSLQHA